MARDERGKRERWAVGGVSNVPITCRFLLVVGILGCMASVTDAAYRLTFQNGTSVEVQAYDDVGDAIRYPRYGGTITVPKANVAAIREVSPPPPPPSAPASSLPSGTFRSLGQTGTPTRTADSTTGASARPISPPMAAHPAPIRHAPGQARRGGGGTAGGVSAWSLLFLVVLVATGLVGWLRRSDRIAGDEHPLPYEQNGPLLSPAERSFYGVLCQAVEPRYPIFAKVGLGDLLRIPRGSARYRTYRNKIDRKHVDFVLCAPHDLSPLLVLELDDASHGRLDRRDRDAFVNRALDAAGLPILHVPAQHAYVPAELRRQIEERLQAVPSSPAVREVQL